MSKVEQLHGLDAAFLYLETPTQHMHITGTMILEPGAAERAQPGERGAGDARAATGRLAELLASRLASLPEFRRRLVDAPFGLTHPSWVAVPNFRPREHVRRATLLVPGTLDQLADEVGRIAASPLDRSRPLWELWAIDGLEDGRVGVVLKVHHSMIDGVAALQVLARLFTMEAEDSTDMAPGSLEEDEAAPGVLDFARSAVAAAVQVPSKLVHALVHTGRALTTLTRDSISLIVSRERPAALFSAPRTLLNRALTTERAVAFGKVQLDTVKRIKNEFGVTVNDVVLAACARALGMYLRECGERPEHPLVTTIPVSEHGIDNAGTMRNRVSAMFVGLPVHIEDAALLVHTVHDQSVGAKRLYDSFGPEMLAEWIDLAPPGLFASAASLYSRWKLADRVPPAHSVVISNVPGPPVPLYAGSSRLIAAYPLGPILEGAAVNISVMSYNGSVDIGLITCPQSIPDPHVIARGFERAIDELAMAAERRVDLCSSKRSARA
jgi:diacylglycerol O-acyltransferase